VYDPQMTFTILSGRWVGHTGCPVKSSTKSGHPTYSTKSTEDYFHRGKVDGASQS
jgi:hypothetical protein